MLVIGGMLRDDLIEQIDAFVWESDSNRAAKIRAALESGKPDGESYLVNDEGWEWDDIDFVRELVRAVEDEFGDMARSRGLRCTCDTPYGRQIEALREQL